MDFAETRALVRLRHEVRRLLADGRGADARELLRRMRALVEADPVEAADVEPELERWEFRLSG
jgi:hypothetical protein